MPNARNGPGISSCIFYVKKSSGLLVVFTQTHRLLSSLIQKLFSGARRFWGHYFYMVSCMCDQNLYPSFQYWVLFFIAITFEYSYSPIVEKTGVDCEISVKTTFQYYLSLLSFSLVYKVIFKTILINSMLIHSAIFSFNGL